DAVNSLPATLTDATTIHLAASTGVADTQTVASTPWDMTTSATNYLLIQGNNRTGKYQTAAPYYRMEVTNPVTGTIYNNIPCHWRIDGVQIKVTCTGGGSDIGFKSTNANQTATDIDCRISNCICWGVVPSGSTIRLETRWQAPGANGRNRVWNCLAIDCTTGFNNDFGPTNVASVTSPGEFYNCTADGCSFSYVEDADMKVINCLSAAATSIGFVGTFVTGSDYHAEDDGNGAPGAHSRTLQTFTFVNAAADDFHLAATDAGARDFGTADPSGGIFLDDVDGQTRVAPWDIGFDEYVAAVRASSGGLLLGVY